MLTDAISDLLFVTEQSGIENLRREGVHGDKVHLVGNVMIDTLMNNRDKAEQSNDPRSIGLDAGEYDVVTLHRPSNVDDADSRKNRRIRRDPKGFADGVSDASADEKEY